MRVVGIGPFFCDDDRVWKLGFAMFSRVLSFVSQVLSNSLELINRGGRGREEGNAEKGERREKRRNL